jgi:hypothetical protein
MTKQQTAPCGTLAPVFVKHVELTRRWAEEVLEAVSGFDDVYDTRVDEVENRHRDGFIPFTDGGFDGWGYATMSYAHGASCAPKVIQPYIDRTLKDVETDWDAENPDHPTSWLFASDEEEAKQLEMFGPSRERDHWREKYWEIEREAFEDGSTYFYKVRVLFHGDLHRSESGEPEAFFMVGVNTDFEYGRDNIPWLTAYGSDPQCTKWVWEKTVKVSKLTPKMIDGFIKKAVDALCKA